MNVYKQIRIADFHNFINLELELASPSAKMERFFMSLNIKNEHPIFA